MTILKDDGNSSFGAYARKTLNRRFRPGDRHRRAELQP